MATKLALDEQLLSTALNYLAKCQLTKITTIKKGVLLNICAIASRLDIEIFTTDNDFKHYANHLPINLFQQSKTEN